MRGAYGDRRFYLIDADGRMYDSLRDGQLLSIRADIDETSETARFSFPDGRAVTGPMHEGEPVQTLFYGRATPVAGHVVEGPWSDAVSAFIGRPLRLVRSSIEGAALDEDRAITLVSAASVAALSSKASRDVDSARFRMTFEVAGALAHDEDRWIGQRLFIGSAVVIPISAVKRCAVTTRNPTTGTRDLDTLRILKSYRPQARALDLGVAGIVERPGTVRVGDPVEVLDTP